MNDDLKKMKELYLDLVSENKELKKQLDMAQELLREQSLRLMRIESLLEIKSN